MPEITTDKIDVTLEEASKKDIQSIEEAPESFGSWLNLELSEEKLQTITDRILEEINNIEEDRAPWYEKVKQYRNMYNQKVKETSLPFSGSFNLCVPLSNKIIDACVSQTEEAFEDVDPKWVIQMPPDKNLADSKTIQEKALDYFSDTEMDFRQDWNKVYHDAYLLGTGWMCMTFKREFTKVRDYVEYKDLASFQKDYPKDWFKYKKYIDKLSKGETVSLVVEYNQEMYRSPKPEHVEWEDVYVPVKTNGLEGMLKSRLIARYVPKRWEEIYIDETRGDYIKGKAEKLRTKEGDNGMPEIDPEYLKKTYDTFEVQYFVDIDDDNVEERCLFNIEKEHRLCLRAIRYPYNHNHPYIIPYYIQTNLEGIYQAGMGEKLINLNIALNAVLNHTLNSSVIANSLSLKVRSGTDAVRALYEHQWYPGSILELMNVDDVQQFNFATPNLSSLLNLFSIIERFGEDISGMSNYVFGQESSQDPTAPASKTLALMQRSEIKLRSYIKCLKRSNNEAGYQALRLIYQYVPKSTLAQILGIDEAKITQVFQYPLKAITQASGFAIEKIFAKKDNMEFIQMLLKDPLISGDPKRRVTAYRLMANDWGSNWDKKVDTPVEKDQEGKAVTYLVPAVEEIQQHEQEAQQAELAKKQEVITKAVHGVLDQGGTPEQAQEVAHDALSHYDMLKQQPPQPQKGGK